MSDCSTQAMMPKERRICGTCAHGDYRTTVYCPVSGNDMLVTCPACEEWDKRIWTGPFEAYMPNGERVASFAGYSLEEAYSILVRHERLAQVALWMYDTMRDFCAKAYADEAKERLKQCGVSVDD